MVIGHFLVEVSSLCLLFLRAIFSAVKNKGGCDLKTFWLGIRISKTPTREKEREKTKKLKEKKPSSVQENKGDEEPAGDY